MKLVKLVKLETLKLFTRLKILLYIDKQGRLV
jgi:hypothetical protein